MRGSYFDELHVGDVFVSRRRTITEADIVLFASLANLLSPLFNDDIFAKEHHFQGRIAPGPLTFAYSIGLTEDISHGTALAALGFDGVRFHKPVYPNDTLYVRSEVRELRESQKRPETGVVTMHHDVFNQHGTLVAEYLRTLLYGTRAYFAERDPEK